MFWQTVQMTYRAEITQFATSAMIAMIGNIFTGRLSLDRTSGALVGLSNSNVVEGCAVFSCIAQ